MSKYPPIFKRVPMDEGTNHVGMIQSEFEKFWRHISQFVNPNSEKTQAMRKMQEACMWLCRAEALNHFKPELKEGEKAAEKPKYDRIETKESFSTVRKPNNPKIQVKQRKKFKIDKSSPD